MLFATSTENRTECWYVFNNFDELTMLRKEVIIMGNGVTFTIIGEFPMTIGKTSVAIRGRRYELLRSYVNRGVRHFVAAAFGTGEKIDFSVKGKNALIYVH